MKKVIKSRIFLVIICGIVFTSIGVYAATIYNATDIVYNASDGTSMTVNDALNELYNNNIKVPVLVTSFSEGTKITNEYTFTKDYDYIIISGSGVNDYDNVNAGIKITFADEVELVKEFNKSRIGDGAYYSRLTTNIYKNIKVGDKVSIYLGYGSSSVIYGIES